MVERRSQNFCSQCGVGLRTGDAYCSQCGAVVGGPQTRYGTHEESRRELDRRVDELLARGWEIDHESDDRTRLVDRGIGSIGIHVLLLLFTGGIGNLLYGWYSYSMNADRIELRADGTRRLLHRKENAGTTEADRAAMDWAFSLLVSVSLLFLGVTLLLSGASVTAAAVGLICLTGAVFVLPPTRRRLAARRSVDTFGRIRETDERVVEQPETPCSSCATPVDRGVERRYGERTYVAGIPFYTRERGRNAYCQDCASGESFDRNETTESATENEFA